VDTWAELYADPATAKVLDEFWRAGIEDGKATILDHQPFLLRNGERLEEKIFNLSLLPILDENGETVGFYEPLTEITTDHLNERRSDSVRKIGELTAGEEDPVLFFQSIMRALAGNGKCNFSILHILPTKSSQIRTFPLLYSTPWEAQSTIDQNRSP
jgi:hypothetical protein